MNIFRANEHVLALLSQRLGCAPFAPGTMGFGASDRTTNTLSVAVVFDDWRPDNGTVELWFATWHKGRATPSVISFGLAYAFDALECRAVLARRALDNEASGRFMRKLGFSETVVPNLFGAHDGVLASLSRDAWRASRFYREVQ